MPRRSDKHWQSTPTPESILEQSAFLDTCIAWLTDEPCSAKVVAPFERTRLLPTRRSGRLLSYSHSEINYMADEQCRRCGAELHIVTANPFTQRCFMLSCGQCGAVNSAD